MSTSSRACMCSLARPRVSNEYVSSAGHEQVMTRRISFRRKVSHCLGHGLEKQVSNMTLYSSIERHMKADTVQGISRAHAFWQSETSFQLKRVEILPERKLKRLLLLPKNRRALRHRSGIRVSEAYCRQAHNQHSTWISTYYHSRLYV